MTGTTFASVATVIVGIVSLLVVILTRLPATAGFGATILVIGGEALAERSRRGR